MNSESLNPNVEVLQPQVIELLKLMETLMVRAGTNLKSDAKIENKYQSYAAQIATAAENVENLELKMAIVAPMKAGKSTIINGIVGQNILPSRNAAMTTLPTAIICNDQLAEPKLLLSEEIRQIFSETLQELERKINQLDSEQTPSKIEQYPHLKDLSEQIKQGNWRWIIEPEITGKETIIKALTSLNDIIRLCVLLAPETDPLRKIIDIPRIQTPFWLSSSNSEDGKKTGNLVIIDTPGPNEAGDNLRLAGVVTEQLEKSSIVLIVLDFTQLKTEAAEKVKQDVEKVINLRGKENLYVLINKVDLRRDGDLTVKEVKQFVSAELGIGNVEDTDRVFELSARRAFAAANFIQEIRQNPNLAPTDMETSKALAQEVFGIDWEEDLEDATIKQLEKKAQRLWQKSGFDPFLQKAVATLTKLAAPRTMASALKLGSNLMIELQDDIKLRYAASMKDAEKIQQEILALEADLNSLESCRTKLQGVDTIKRNLNRKLEQIFSQCKQIAKIDLNDYFDKEEYKRANVLEKLSIDSRNLWKQAINNVTFFPSWFSDTIKSKQSSQNSAIFEFKSQKEADRFGHQATAQPKAKVENLLSFARKEVDKEIEKASTGLTDFLDKETQPIIERARKRLNEAFNVDLSLPQPGLTAEELDWVKPRVKTNTRWVDGGYKEVQEVKTRKKTGKWWNLWYGFGLFAPEETYYETRRVKNKSKEENYYTVSLKELIDQFNRSIEANINKLQQKIDKYLDEDFKERVDDYLDNLKNYLGQYDKALKQAQKDKKLEQEKQEELKAEFELILPESNKYIEQAEAYLKVTDDLIQQTK